MQTHSAPAQNACLDKWPEENAFKKITPQLFYVLHAILQWFSSEAILMFLCCSIELFNAVIKLIFVFNVVVIYKWTHNKFGMPHSNTFEIVM